MKPLMSTKEIEMFQLYLQKSKTYVEYGSGGSTCLACKTECIEHITTIESNDNWVNKIKQDDSVKQRLEKGSIVFIVIDILGNPHFWGFPINNTKKENWPLYSQAIRTTSNTPPDMILIDGRFRVACAIQAFLLSDATTMILIHDYENRSHYHIVLEFLDVVEKVDTLVVFRKRTDIDDIRLEQIYDTYKYDAR